MSSPLSQLPVVGRRRLVLILAGFVALLLAIGAVTAAGGGSAAAPVFSAIAFAAAIVLGLIAWGVRRSIAIDLSDQRLDAAIDEALAARGGRAALCDCGHEHDPTELHITDAEPCGHDGAGTACAHDCQTCVLASLRSE